jgi:DNA end-binding protein Ku
LYRKVCSACGEEARPDTIALGYEAGPDTFVVLSEEELGSLPGGPDHSVEIERFVPRHSVDPLFLAKAYYLEPAPGGHKAYQLLRRAMDEEGRAAVVRIALRQRERWALVRAGEAGVMHLETLLDADEVRSAGAIEVGEEAALRPGELELARDLVRTLAAEFHPEDSPDRYREALTALIERKVAGGEARTAPQAESAKVIDLMQALRQSLEAAGPGAGGASAGAAAEPTEGRGRRGRREPIAPPPRTHAGARGGAGVR